MTNLDFLAPYIPLVVPIVVMAVRGLFNQIPGKFVPTIVAVAGAVGGLLTGDGAEGAALLTDLLTGAFTGLAGVGVAEVVLAPKRAAEQGK